jgi:hypothetical protein
LIGIQLPEKYKENFNVSSEGPSSGTTAIQHKLNVQQEPSLIDPVLLWEEAGLCGIGKACGVL